jgi:hypothetical protein
MIEGTLARLLVISRRFPGKRLIEGGFRRWGVGNAVVADGYFHHGGNPIL